MKPPSKVLIVLAAGDAYPSGFVRGLIYKDHFRRSGLAATYVSRLFPPLVRFIDTPPRFLWRLVAAGLGAILARVANALAWVQEWMIVRRARRFDVVYLSKVTSARLITGLRRHTRARLVLDFVDALWLSQRAGERFSGLLAQVDAVTTDNEVNAAYVTRVNPHCTVVPDCPQVEWFDRHRAPQRASDVVTIGWIGTPNTVHNLFVAWEALEHLFERHTNLHLRLVGVGPDRRCLPPFERVAYSTRPRYTQAEMIEEVQKMDIGIFPLQDVEDSRARGVLKATVYMAGGAAVVCSAVGQCRELIQDGTNGFLATTPAEWETKLDALITNRDLRARLADAALQLVRNEFTVEQSFRKLLPVLTGGQASS